MLELVFQKIPGSWKCSENIEIWFSCEILFSFFFVEL